MSELVREGTTEFDAEVARVRQELVEKFAWTAQHGGIIYRKGSGAIAPLRDHVFNRLSKAVHSFKYQDKNGKDKLFYYQLDDLIAVIDDDDLDKFGFVIVDAVQFLPNRPSVTNDKRGWTVLNCWQAPLWPAIANPERPSWFLDHIAYLFDNDVRVVQHVIQFVAHLIQRPEERVNHALMLTSQAKGIGKSTFGIVLRRLIGEQNSGVANAKDLKGQFDGWLIGKSLVQVDEIYEHGNFDLANKLKPLITDPTVSVNVKYGPQMQVDNCARFIIFSNHTSPIDIEDGDRRYFMFDSHAQPRDSAYYEALNAAASDHQKLAELYNYLLQLDISSFRPYDPPPVTAAKEAAIAASGHPIRHYIRDAVESGHFAGELGMEFTMDALQRQLQRDGQGAFAKAKKEITKALKEAGVEPVRLMVNGERSRKWRLPAQSEAVFKMDDF